MQVFAPWGDSSPYASLLNGGFEGGSAGWDLSGGARVVSGNEPFYVESSTRQPLPAPARGQLGDSGTVCFAAGDWHLRLFAKNVGSRTGPLHVQVVVPSLLGGLLTVLDGGTISGDGVWAPSPRLELLLCNVTACSARRRSRSASRPTGPGAAFQIDDVYLDPWKDR